MIGIADIHVKMFRALGWPVRSQVHHVYVSHFLPVLHPIEYTIRVHAGCASPRAPTCATPAPPPASHEFVAGYNRPNVSLLLFGRPIVLNG